MWNRTALVHFSQLCYHDDTITSFTIAVYTSAFCVASLLAIYITDLKGWNKRTLIRFMMQNVMLLSYVKNPFRFGRLFALVDIKLQPRWIYRAAPSSGREAETAQSERNKQIDSLEVQSVKSKLFRNRHFKGLKKQNKNKL